MKRQIKIAPSLLASDFSNLQREVELAESIGADMLHIDIMDGVFVPSLTIGAVVVEAIRPHSRICFDVHLMIESPERYIADYIRAGADSITISYESTNHVQRAVQMVKDANKRVCVAINPSTPVGALEDLICDLDMVLIMGVNPGYGGQKYIPFTTGRIMKLYGMLKEKGLDIDIQVDGGVQEDNIGEIAAAGANVFVAGTAVYRAPNPSAAIMKLRKNAENNLCK